jgi:hypothetical protein
MSIFANRSTFIATMHHKEQMIAPLIEKALGLKCITSQDFDTDVFGTFTGEVARPASQLETLRMKCKKGLEISNLEICIASEGSFGAHPTLPILPANIEMVMLTDKLFDIEVVGQVLSTETNFSKQVVSSWEEAYKFAEKANFPTHALIVQAVEGDTKQTSVFKGIHNTNEFQCIVIDLLKKYKLIQLETDMRAMHNPKRRKVIAQATEVLIKKLQSACPQCGQLGFSAVDIRLGLPCEDCGLPTRKIIATIWQCARCKFVKEELYPQGIKKAEATYCSFCNP